MIRTGCYRPPKRCLKCPFYWPDLKYCRRLGKLIFSEEFNIYIKENGMCSEEWPTKLP
jgi:hypothetical protein